MLNKKHQQVLSLAEWRKTTSVAEQKIYIYIYILFYVTWFLKTPEKILQGPFKFNLFIYQTCREKPWAEKMSTFQGPLSSNRARQEALWTRSWRRGPGRTPPCTAVPSGKPATHLFWLQVPCLEPESKDHAFCFVPPSSKCLLLKSKWEDALITGKPHFSIAEECSKESQKPTSTSPELKRTSL